MQPPSINEATKSDQLTNFKYFNTSWILSKVKLLRFTYLMLFLFLFIVVPWELTGIGNMQLSTTPLILHHILLCNQPWVDLPEVTSGENKGSTKHTIENFIFNLDFQSLSAAMSSSKKSIKHSF